MGPGPSSSRAWKCWAPDRAWAFFRRENAGLRNCQDASGWHSGRPLTRGAAKRFAFGQSRPWEAMNGLKLKKFWKWWSPERQKNVKWCLLRTGFVGHLWKWYAPERKFRAENGGLSRGTYPICIHMEVPPPPPPGWSYIQNLQVMRKL